MGRKSLKPIRQKGIIRAFYKVARKEGLENAKVDEKLHYRGKVGTGFDESTAKEIMAALKKIKVIKRPDVIGKLLDETVSTWLDATVIVEVSYSKITPDKMFREPVFIRLRPDLE